jgi:hypothetical protein
MVTISPNTSYSYSSEPLSSTYKAHHPSGTVASLQMDHTRDSTLSGLLALPGRVQIHHPKLFEPLPVRPYTVDFHSWLLGRPSNILVFFRMTCNILASHVCNVPRVEVKGYCWTSSGLGQRVHVQLNEVRVGVEGEKEIIGGDDS